MWLSPMLTIAHRVRWTPSRLIGTFGEFGATIGSRGRKRAKARWGPPEWSGFTLSQGSAKVIKMHALGSMAVRTNAHGNPSDRLLIRSDPSRPEDLDLSQTVDNPNRAKERERTPSPAADRCTIS
ncbi:hypothetical protein EYF80_029202 [Liparis tanakae]|uniref:Uncharacterized protein n=1 Tax=Liparis tanakae TaxID=230148 RepID=A0A4Z2H4P6_9TELE|nr:hypothetical protein EYF80_029202 [Liparis tanakae]